MVQSDLKNVPSQTLGNRITSEVIPEAYPELFSAGIAHPDLYLWDAWSARDGEETHLYCLAVSAKEENGKRFAPELRNQKSFHIRHFRSNNNGETWQDLGCFQSARAGRDLFDSKSIWSGSVLLMPDGRILMGYTGIREKGDTFAFHQSLALSTSKNWDAVQTGSQTLISDPLFDYEKIIEQGYFLGEREALGHKDGEADGPILAWRDPYLLLHEEQVHMFWSAKSDSKSPALGHALLSETEGRFVMTKLYPAVAMPDGDEYTQLELPKVMYDNVRNRFLMLVSSCNRLHERQSDKEADKRMRLYTSKSLEGPWHKCGHSGSRLNLADPNMFGVTVIDADFQQQKLWYVAPFTEDAGEDKFLTLSQTYCLDISQLGVATNADSGGGITKCIH